MATYDLTHELDPDDEAVHSATPSWVLCVVRFQQLSTYSRDKKGSSSTDGSVSAAERGNPLIIVNDCTQLVTSTSKRSHVSSLSATLKLTNTDYLSEVMPGDWIFCWMTETEERSADVVDRIKKGQAVNKFNDGLKFLGRVYSVFKNLGINPGTGAKQVSYDLVANGFNEFDTGVYFNPYLSIAQPYVNTWMGNLSIAVDKFLGSDGIDVNLAIPTLLELLFGRGISQKTANPATEKELQGVDGLTTGDGEAPFSYVVPSTVGKLLGKTSRSKTSGIFAYADLLQSIIGIQKYSNSFATGPTTSSSANNKVAGFAPSQLKPMLGEFVPEVSPFSGRPVWSILSQYLNPAVNEMYTCLRTDEDGNILPTFIARQLPFTSSIAATDDRTSFLELPRWKVPGSMITRMRVGRSDALRCNFVKMNGIAPAQAQPDVNTFQDVRNPPIRDDQDIRRSGLRSDIQMISCGIEDQQKGPGQWNELRADILMGQHLTLTGTIDMHGIEAPICEGDNFEIGYTVFHIESVVHTCAVMESGKRFMTTLQLSLGVRSDADGTPKAPVTAQGDDIIYQSLGPGDLRDNEPGIGEAGGDEDQHSQPAATGPGDFPAQSGGGGFA